MRLRLSHRTMAYAAALSRTSRRGAVPTQGRATPLARPQRQVALEQQKPRPSRPEPEPSKPRRQDDKDRFYSPGSGAKGIPVRLCKTEAPSQTGGPKASSGARGGGTAANWFVDGFDDPRQKHA